MLRKIYSFLNFIVLTLINVVIIIKSHNLLGFSMIGSNFVFCPPLPGKVNPLEGSSSPHRSRIPQRADKGIDGRGEVCKYYALQILRDELKVGKFPAPQHLEARKFEQRASRHRKEMTMYYSDHLSFTFFSQNVKQCLNMQFNRADAQSILDTYMHRIVENEQGTLRELLNGFLEGFIKQNETDSVDEYINILKLNQYIDFDLEFCREFSIDIDSKAKSIWPYVTFEKILELSLQQRHAIGSAMVLDCMREKYGLQYSSWHPSQGIQKLMIEIERHGPHFVGGWLGENSYQDQPFQLKDKIQGRCIFGWKPNAVRHKAPEPHAIVIVGAEILGSKEYIYFLDPNNGSDPASLESQRIYKISYQKLLQSIHDLRGYIFYETNPASAADTTLVLSSILDGTNYYAIRR